MPVAITSTTELADSSHLASEGEALRARVASDGYVFLRGLLDPALVRHAGRRGLTYLQEAGWTELGGDPLQAPPRPPVRAERMRDAFADPAYLRVATEATFNQIGFSAPLEGLMQRLLGPAGFCYPRKLPRVVYPSSLVPHQPGGYVHKDYRAVQDMFTCWVPLGDVPRSLGGLALRPGSQHSTRAVPRPLERLPQGWLTTDYEAGDVLVFHCLTTHAALPNREQRMRFSGEYRWQLADRPAPQRLVVGRLGQEIGSRMFSRLPWWHPVPAGLSFFDDSGVERGLRPVPPSRFVTFVD